MSFCAADLRGLGGAGIPAVQKWKDVRDAVRRQRLRERDDRALHRSERRRKRNLGPSRTVSYFCGRRISLGGSSDSGLSCYRSDTRFHFHPTRVLRNRLKRVRREIQQEAEQSRELMR